MNDIGKSFGLDPVEFKVPEPEEYDFPDDLQAAEDRLGTLIVEVQSLQVELGRRRGETRHSRDEWQSYNDWKAEAQSTWIERMDEVRELRLHIRDLKVGAHAAKPKASAMKIVDGLVTAYRDGRSDDVLRLLAELSAAWFIRTVIAPPETSE